MTQSDVENMIQVNRMFQIFESSRDSMGKCMKVPKMSGKIFDQDYSVNLVIVV